MKKFLIGGIVLALALAIPVTLTLVSQQQDIRQQASTTSEGTNNWNNWGNWGQSPTPTVSVSITQTGGNFQQNSFLCSYYQNYLARLQSAGTCTSNPTICNQITTQLKNLNCTNTGPSPSSTPKVSGSPTRVPTAGPTFPPITPANPPIYNALVDLNDDGKIDELDLNILYAGFAKRKGD